MAVRRLLAITVPSVLIATLAGALAIEVWVRSTWDPRRGRPGFFLSDPVRGQRLAAGYDGWFAGVPVHINSLELRDPREYPLEKSPRTFRILVLGDSVTFGHGSIYEHTYPYLLEQRLKTWHPEIDWQVWNAAVPGYNTSQELAQLLEIGERFRPDLVIVGFFGNDLYDNAPVRQPAWPRVLAARVSSFARRHLYSFEFYKRVYLTMRWRLSRQEDDRLRAEHAADEDSLLAVKDMTKLPQQQITPFDRLSDEEMSAVACPDGMRPNPATLARIRGDSGFDRWVEAVRGFQKLEREGRYRIVFFVNAAPAVCGPPPNDDYFYDGGTRDVNDLYLEILGQGTPAFSSYDAFFHVRPSQMPAADAHSIGNANVVKADALFRSLRQAVLPPLVSNVLAAATR
jgi:hypothetical protein